MPLEVYLYISTPRLQQLYSYITLTAIFCNLSRHSEALFNVGNERKRHIFVAFPPWIHINISWNKKCPSKWLLLASLFTFWPPPELSVHFQHIMLHMQDIWSLHRQKKRSKTREMNSKRLSSVSYHDVKLKQFIKSLGTTKKKEEMGLMLEFDCLQFFCLCERKISLFDAE